MQWHLLQAEDQVEEMLENNSELAGTGRQHPIVCLTD